MIAKARTAQNVLYWISLSVGEGACIAIVIALVGLVAGYPAREWPAGVFEGMFVTLCLARFVMRMSKGGEQYPVITPRARWLGWGFALITLAVVAALVVFFQ